MHRAGTDDDKKTIVGAAKDAMYCLAPPRDGASRSAVTGNFADYGCWRAEFVKRDNAEVICSHQHGVVSVEFCHTGRIKKAARWLAAAGIRLLSWACQIARVPCSAGLMA